MIITISGTPGSGKSTLAELLAQKLHAERIYVGGIRRELARKKGMTITELNEYAKIHPETDVDIDAAAAATARTLEKKGKLVILEGRPQFHFFPRSLKIYIKVDFKQAAQRIWKQLRQEGIARRNEAKLKSIAELQKELEYRHRLDAARFKKYYGIDHRDESQYDFVLDTSGKEIRASLTELLAFLKTQKLINPAKNERQHGRKSTAA